MSGLGFEILVIFLLILANGVFSLAEIAVVSSRKHRLQQQAEEGNSRAGVALELANEPNSLLSTVQIGITLVGTLAGAFGGATVAEPLAARLNTIALIAPYGESVAISLVVIGITAFTIVLGELVPKRIALSNPERFASLTAPFMKTISRLVSPVVRLLGWATEQVLKILPRAQSERKEITEEEIKILIEKGTEAGTFEETEQEMVEGVFELGERRVVDLMRPRNRIIWLDIDESSEEIRDTILSNTHSRFPVAQGNLDNILGYVHVKDLLSQCISGEPVDLRKCMRQLPGVPELMTALRVLELFRKSGTHIALVISEFGGTEGLITLNDVVEAIVGDLPVGNEETEPMAKQREDGSWLVDGAMPVFEFKELIGVRELPGEEGIAYTTLGGFVLMQLGRIPSASECFEAEGWKFEVIDMDGNRVDKVLVSRVEQREP